jgi:predicted nucleic acid-binding protein
MGLLSELEGPRVYLNTNILIYWIEGFSTGAAELQELFDAFAEGRLTGVTSELTLAEVLVRPIADGKHHARVAYERAVRDSAEFAVLPVSREILIRAAGIRARDKLKLPDAIHVATAEFSHCTTFLTNDARLKRLAGFRVVVLSEVSGGPRPN